MTPCSPSSRHGLEAVEFVADGERRPALTAAARGVRGKIGRDEETASWSNQETDPSKSPIGASQPIGLPAERIDLARPCLRGPWRAALHHRVDIDDEFSGARDERDLVRLA